MPGNIPTDTPTSLTGAVKDLALSAASSASAFMQKHTNPWRDEISHHRTQGPGTNDTSQQSSPSADTTASPAEVRARYRDDPFALDSDDGEEEHADLIDLDPRDANEAGPSRNSTQAEGRRDPPLGPQSFVAGDSSISGRPDWKKQVPSDFKGGFEQPRGSVRSKSGQYQELEMVEAQGNAASGQPSLGETALGLLTSCCPTAASSDRLRGKPGRGPR